VSRLAALGAAAAVGLALAATASATISIGRGISGVVLGMGQPAVRAKLGRPVKVVHATNEFGPYTEYRYRGYVVDFQSNAAVTSVVTTLARERTPAGVGVGSTWTQVRTGVPGVTCEGSPSLGHCHVGALVPGHRVTDFFFQNRRVSRVVVGFVLD
jgi:hypothetical protein